MDILKNGSGSRNLFEQAISGRASSASSPVATASVPAQPISRFEASLKEAEDELWSIKEAVQTLERALEQPHASAASVSVSSFASADLSLATEKRTASPSAAQTHQVLDTAAGAVAGDFGGVVSPAEAMALMQGFGAVQLDVRSV